jgi:hypothetical protein
MSEPTDFIGMSEHLGQLRSEVERMPPKIRPIGQASLAALTAARDRVMRDAKDLDHLRALLRRAHDAMSQSASDGVPEADWNQLLADMAKEVGL